MLHDLVVVGAGPVGATLALALRDVDLEVVVLDSRSRGAPSRSDRSLALSHGARLILERLDVWRRLAAGDVTPITSIDISQGGGFGMTRLVAADHDLPALGYVVSYRALQNAMDAALEHARIEISASLRDSRPLPTAVERASMAFAAIETTMDTLRSPPKWRVLVSTTVKRTNASRRKARWRCCPKEMATASCGR
jgi:2-octaprenyl-6-methoxyphenol hydroxylase